MQTAPYDYFSDIYDKVMVHVDYKLWTRYVEKMFRHANREIDTIVDVSCGTGGHLTQLLKDNYTLVGADISRSMITRAQKKLSGDLKKKIFLNDARDIALKDDCCDCLLMLYDSINYMMEDRDVLKLFSEAKRILSDGGIFIFDFITIKNVTEYFHNYYETNSWDGMAYERNCWFDEKQGHHHTEFKLLYYGDFHYEEHVQKIRTINKWKCFVEKSAMQLIAEFSNFSYNTLGENSDRVHFVCRV